MTEEPFRAALSRLAALADSHVEEIAFAESHHADIVSEAGAVMLTILDNPLGMSAEEIVVSTLALMVAIGYRSGREHGKSLEKWEDALK